jgi:ferric-dicitrate binding protein FerR (iron transport regulator)
VEKGRAENSPNQEAARWYARLHAPDCTAEERADFDAWRAGDPRNAAAYAAAERMSDAVASLAMTDPRLKAMVDQAASAGATLPDDTPDDEPGGKARPLTITASPRLPRRRIA